jgi:polyribonucleotide nucleotidyltransferase
VVRETVTLGARELVIETGEVARQAGAAVLVSEGDTVLMAVCTAAHKPTHLPYMPLTVEYRHRMSAAGLIPGGYERREAKATSLEVLVSRVVDRSIRPFFVDGWCYDTQVILSPLSYDPESDMAPLSITAAAAALALSDVPFPVCLAGVRVARCDGELVAFPTFEQRERCDLEFVLSLSREGVVMLEGGADEASEDDILAAFALAEEAVAPLHDLMDRLSKAARAKREVTPATLDDAVVSRVNEGGAAGVREALTIVAKHERYHALDAVRATLLDSFDESERDDAKAAYEKLKKRLVRESIVAGTRIGGRTPEEIREITGRVSWLPKVHGSSLFTRGETQVIATCTLAEKRRSQRIESMEGDVDHRFLLHYSFPAYCVGEVRPMRGPGRREIGHGFLARRALLPVLPSQDDWPYVMRIESTVTESNGSSSMATVCGGSMAMFDAGVPLLRPVAGIAMGLVKEGETYVILSDILGDEDHVGDMDFKVCGTERGVTAIQLDNKLGSLPMEVMRRGLEQAKAGRLHILERMAVVIAETRPALPPHAPRIEQVQIERGRIRDLIGPGGKRINGIREETGVQVDVDDDGRVTLFGPSAETISRAREQVEDLTGLPVVNREYDGRVTGVKHFGSFVRLFQGIEGLLPGAQLSVGQTIRVRVSGVNFKGKLELQRA